MLSLTVLVTLAAFYGQATAQMYLDGFEVDGKSYPGDDPFTEGASTTIFKDIYSPAAYPVSDITNKDMRCGVGSAHPVGAVVPVHAGSELKFSWRYGNVNPGWYQSYAGPVINYIASCDGDCKTFNPTAETKWYKVFQEGLIDVENTKFATSQMVDSPYSMTLPSGIPAGQYLLRHEVIALNAAPGTIMPFVQCIGIEVTGDSGTLPEEKSVVFPGAYSLTDPGLSRSIYYPKLEQYEIPGGPVVFGASVRAEDAPTKSEDAPAEATPDLARAPLITMRAPTPKMKRHLHSH